MEEDIQGASSASQDTTQPVDRGSNSPQMFTGASHLSVQGANRFTNVGGGVYHVNPSLSVVVQHDTIADSSAAVTSASERPTCVPTQFVQQPEHASEVYARILMPKRHGYPLWYPEPPSNLHSEHQKSGMRIGDVGLITANGDFDFLFNICLPSDHPINGNSVPEDFLPIATNIEERDIRTDHNAWRSGSHVSNGSVRTLEPRSITEFIGQYSFEGFASEGALLTLPEGAMSVDLLALSSFCDYAGQNGYSWYKFANGRRGRMAANGSLYLVTGFDKASAWGTASFSSVLGDSAFKMTFMDSTPIGGGGGRLRHYVSSPFIWNETGCAATKEGPYLQRSDTDTQRPINQTVFLRGFRVALAESIWASFKRKVHVVSIKDMNTTALSQKAGFVPFFRGQSNWIRNLTFGNQSRSNRGRKHPGSSPGTTGSDVVLFSEVEAPRVDLHPLYYINQQLLQNASLLVGFLFACSFLLQFPEAEVAVTHDDIWCTALDEETLASRNQAECLSRIIQKYYPVCANGVVVLTSREDRNIKQKPVTPLPSITAISRAHAIKWQGDRSATIDSEDSIGAMTESEAVAQATDKLGKLILTNVPHEQGIYKLSELVLKSELLNQGHRPGLPRCHKNTRDEVRAEINFWFLDAKSKPILWLNGPIGIGKSTVLRTLSDEWFQSNNKGPGAYFSFLNARSCDEEQNTLVSTLAYQLAQIIPSFRQSIADAIDKNPILLRQPLETQFEHLIVSPLMAARSISPNLQVVIVIDDLENAYKLEPSFPARFLIASRRDTQIGQYFRNKDLHRLLYEIRLDEYSPTADIKHFLVDELRKIQEDHPCDIDASWPPNDMINLLVYKSSGQFLYSSIAVQFVGGVESDPRSRLELICRSKNPQATPDRPFLIIDHLYIRILNCVKETSRRTVRSILGSLCFEWGALAGWYGMIFNGAVYVQSPRFLERLFFMEEGQLLGHLIDLGSVLDIPRDNEYSTTPIRPFHPSFFEFLTDSNRSGDFCIDEKQAHLLRQVTLMKHIFIFLSMPTISSPYNEQAVVRLFSKGMQRMYLEDGGPDNKIFRPDQELQSGLVALMSSSEQYLAYLKSMNIKQEHCTSWRCTFRELITPSEESCICHYLKDCAIYDTSAPWSSRTWQRLKWGSRAIFLESAGSYSKSGPENAD